VLHLAVDHVDATAVRDRLEHLLGELHFLGWGTEHLLRDLDLNWMQRPCTDASEQKRRSKLSFASFRVLDVTVGAVEREDAGRSTGVDHARDRVVPGVLLGRSPGLARIVGIGILDHTVRGMTTADARGLHATEGREVGRTEA